MGIIQKSDRQKWSDYGSQKHQSHSNLIAELDAMLPAIVDEIIKAARDLYAVKGKVWLAHTWLPEQFKPLYDVPSLRRIARRRIRKAMKAAEKRTFRVTLPSYADHIGVQVCVEFVPHLR